MTELTPDGVLSPRATAALTSLHRITLWRLHRRGEFPAPVLLTPRGTRIGFRRADVMAWLAARESRSSNQGKDTTKNDAENH
jgi:predicted DNA-binding transcriptional regulator AlpA